MASSIHPQLSHCGVYARDVSKMVDFYTNVVGLVVSDRGISSRGGELAFMTAAPGHHHQFVIVSGRAPGRRQHGQPAVVQGSRSRCAEDALWPRPRGRHRHRPADQPRQRAQLLFPRSRGQPDRNLHGHALVRAAAARRADRPVLAERGDHGRDRAALPPDPGLHAARSMAGRGGQPLEPRLTGRGRSGFPLPHCGRGC